MRGKILILTSLLLVLATEFDYSLLSETINFRHYSLILLAFFSVLIPTLIKTQQLYFIITTPMKWLFLYFIFIVAKMVWTKNIDETYTTLIGIFICILSCFIIANSFDYNFIIKFLIIAVVITSALCLISYAFFNKYSLNLEDFFRFKGIYTHLQRLSAILSVTLLIIFINIRVISKKYYLYSIILVFIFTIITTKTRAFTTFTFVVIVFNYIYSKKNYYFLHSCNQLNSPTYQFQQ